jgi:Fe-S oxidoreductase
MSLSWLVERGELPRDAAHGLVPWACTGCYACRERCDHRNPVVPTLFDARREALRHDVAPPAAKRTVSNHAQRSQELELGLGKLGREPGVSPRAPSALLIGCAYVRRLPEVARDVVRAAVRFLGEVRLVDGCCGAPLLHAGDEQGFFDAQTRLAKSVRGAKALVVADAGCALVSSGLGPVTLSELALTKPSRIGSASDAGAAPVRWHDPCALGRGLGFYEPPRRVLEALLGRPADEFVHNRRHAVCSGGGALLPAVMPENSAKIAESRISEHDSLGGGTIVTACAASLRRLASRGAKVRDLATLLATGKAHG